MLRLVTVLDGELVVGLKPVIGYVHTGIEKNIEQKTYWKAITYVPRMDYLSFFSGETAFCMAIEKALDLEVPRRAEWIRVLFQELNRIHSHLIFLGTGSVDLGGIALLFYCFRDRDLVLDLFEMVTGQRMHPRYCQVGGVSEDLPRGFERECRSFIAVHAQEARRVRRPDRGQPDLAPAHRGRRRRAAGLRDPDGPVRARTCARAASRTTCAPPTAATARTARSATRRSRTTPATARRASACGSRRCAPRWT